MLQEQVTQWMVHLKHGDEVAAGHLWNEYFKKLFKLAERKMKDLPKREADMEDVVLSAINSFCMGMRKHRFDDLHNRDDLWKLLVTITARKVSAQRRRHYAQKRGGGQVQESIFSQSDSEKMNSGIGAVIGSEPTPELAAEVADNVRVLLGQLDDKITHDIALMKLEGYTIDEITKKFDCCRTTVDRNLKLIRKIWGEKLKEWDEE